MTHATSTPATTPAVTSSTTPGNRGRFVWHELMTSDPEAARTFYKHVVGWDTQQWSGGSNIDYTMWMAGETPVGGVMVLPEEAAKMGAPPHWLAYVEVPNVDETTRAATERGASVLVPAQTISGVGRFAVLRDPQGAVFAIITNENALGEEGDPRVMEFSWHELITTDWKAGSEFYQALFGWEKKSEFDMGPMGLYYIFGRDRFSYGGMYNKPADMPAPPHWLHYVRVDNADQAAERATKSGATLLHGPMEVPGGDRIAVLTDPQGAAFAVHSKASA
jgi:predicted enzyme related to lactoylglutathione lyase